MAKVEWTVLDNSNIVESYPNITLPLTYSVVKDAYAGVFRGLLQANVTNTEITEKFEGIVTNMVHSCNGKLYYILNNWYAFLRLVPFSKKIIPIWQEMLGVNKKYISATELPHKFTLWQKICMYKTMLCNMLHIPRDMAKLNIDFSSISAYFNEHYREGLGLTELYDIYSVIKNSVFDKWYVTLENDLYTFVWVGLLKHKLKKKKLTDSEVAEYISGVGNLESLKPVKELLRIADLYGDAIDLLNNPAVQHYIALYGDRSLSELKLEVMTYRENPQALVDTIREYAKDKQKLKNMIDNIHTTHTTGHGFAYKRAALGVSNRETSRLNRSRIYGMLRRIFLSAGTIFVQAGHISAVEDIFYLTKEEVFFGNPAEYSDIIIGRKVRYAEYKTMPEYSRLIYRGTNPNTWKMPITEEQDNQSLGELKGLGISMGKITGEAIVITNPSEDIDVKDKIIITKTTDPGWVFLLTMSKGIVAEKGSLLSHTAIVSRELKIPAIVGVSNATKVINTGDIIELDCDTGVVRFV